MHRLLLSAFLFLSLPLFSQDSATITDTSVVNGTTINHRIGAEKFPSPQKTLQMTLLKGMFSVNINWSHLILGVIIWLILIAAVIIVIVRRRKRLKKRG